jgi:hypothetical protein
MNGQVGDDEAIKTTASDPNAIAVRGKAMRVDGCAPNVAAATD